MLKDEILKSIQIMKENTNKEIMPFEFKGVLDIKAWKNGKLFYHDGGENTITLWAKHTIMHLLTGDNFSYLGTVGKNIPNVSGDASHSKTNKNNTDGYIISQDQYWWDYTAWEGQWSYSNDGFSFKTGNDYYYAYFPTKVLLGTGKEYQNWAHVTSVATTEEQTYLAQTWTSSAVFDTDITIDQNYYSGTVLNGTVYQKYGNYSLVKTRTVNDYVSTKIDGSPDQNEYGITGAVKDGTLTYLDPTKIDATTGILYPHYQGIGRPAFLYCRRNVNWNDNLSETFISNEGLGYENKITFTVTMPEQSAATGTENWFYPYNGYTLKEIGLFNDSLLAVGGEPDNSYSYLNMPAGSMIAKRYISPIRKDASIAISAQWTLYL